MAVSCALALVATATADAQTAGTRATGTPAVAARDGRGSIVLLGPPPPIAPDTISRDADGHATIRAVRIDSPLRLDGRLDDAPYSSVPAISGFIQTEPKEGAPATEKTEMWVFFDDDKIYVSARLWESQPERIVANEMRHDTPNIMQNETFSFMFDTFYDHRNSLVFIVNPLGARTEAQVTDGQYNRDWNTVWDVKTSRFEGGWTVETAIPFKSLRYLPGRTQVWGFNARRIDRWKNELTHLTPIPNALGQNGLYSQPALGATMVGLEGPVGAKGLEIKPYAISNLTTDRSVTPQVSNDLRKNVGLDVKYGITRSLTTDFTYNTDFAQVEADDQQVNLTRFSLFFPEKRDFFLENLGLFGFGGVSPSSATGDVPILFYSRRIGFNQGTAVPINVGGRLTGRIGRYNIGVLNIQSSDEPVSKAQTTDFTVFRLKRDVLKRSSVGLIFSGRSVAQSGSGGNQVYGADGTFGLFTNLAINTYWARTHTDGLSGDDTSYRAQVDYEGDRYGAQLERLTVGSHFNPEIGFVQRADMRRSTALFRFSPRPRAIASVRRFVWTGKASAVENGGGRLETRIYDGEFDIEFQSSDKFVVGINRDYEFLPRPFTIVPGVTLPVQAYDFSSGRVGFNFGQQRRIFGNILAERGTFYDGRKTSIGFSTTRVNVTKQFSIEPTYSLNKVDLVEGRFTTHLVGSRLTYTESPLMFTSALLQYNSTTHSLATNVRLRWEYRPGSELFVVYNEQRDTLAPQFPGLVNRAFIVKINRLFRL